MSSLDSVAHTSFMASNDSFLFKEAEGPKV